MRFQTILTVMALLSLAVTGAATAGDAAASDVVTLDLTPAGGETLYVDGNLDVWTEANGADGLQARAVTDGGVVLLGPDVRLL